MWGNRLGWMISAVIAIGFAAMMTLLVRAASAVTPPTPFGLDPQSSADVTLPVAPFNVMPSMDDSSDAGPIYRQAATIYLRDPAPYESLASGKRPAGNSLQGLAAIELLIEARHAGRMTLFATEPRKVITYDVDDRSELNALHALGRGAVRLGMLLEAEKKPDVAMRLYEAAFSLGAKLYGERVTYDELFTGLQLLGDASAQLAKLSRAQGDTARADAAGAFNAARLKFYAARLQPMARVLLSVDPRVVSTHAGDVMHFAETAGERMWRVEAVLALGRLRFFAGAEPKPGDQRAANRLLKKFAGESDPAIKAAAQAGLALTREEYRLLN